MPMPRFRFARSFLLFLASKSKRIASITVIPQLWPDRNSGLADGDGEGLRLGVAGGVGDGEGVLGGLRGSDVDAAGVGRPDGIGLRLESDGYGVGAAVTELDGLAAANFTRSGVKG